MDNLKSLFDKKQYALIISLSENANDINALLYRINAFIALNNYQGAINVFKNPLHKEMLFKHNPRQCLELHFELLLHEKRYAEAFAELKIYENYPYISQEVEEYLRALPKNIALNQEHDNKKMHLYDEEAILHVLNEEKDTTKIINYLYYLKKLDIAPYLDSLIRLLTKDDVSDEVKTFALLLLIAKKINQIVTIKKGKKIYQINPNQIEPPYVGKKYQSVTRHIGNLAHNPSLANVAINLFNQYLMNVYPENPYHLETLKIALAFYTLAHQYLKSDTKDVVPAILNSHYDSKEILKLASAFQASIEK